MNKFQIIFSLIIFVFTLTDSSRSQTKVFSEAKGIAKHQTRYSFDEWSFSVGKDRYEIRKDGKAKKTNVRNFATNFRIKLDKDSVIENVIYFAQYRNDLLLICEVGLGDAGAGFIVRLDGKTLKTKWRELIHGFNVSKGLIEGDSAYLAAIGFAAKINLETGKYIWKYDDLYRKYKESGAFNIFEVPKIEGKIIIFTENQDDYKRPPNIIKFNKYNGKVIEVKVN